MPAFLHRRACLEYKCIAQASENPTSDVNALYANAAGETFVSDRYCGLVDEFHEMLFYLSFNA
jgi:hypothetical protein